MGRVTKEQMDAVKRRRRNQTLIDVSRLSGRQIGSAIRTAGVTAKEFGAAMGRLASAWREATVPLKDLGNAIERGGGQ